MTILDTPASETVEETPEPMVIDFAPLIKARLREKGWKQFGYGDDQGPNCVMGAVGRVVRAVAGHHPDDFGPIEDSISESLAEALNITGIIACFIDVEEWNDEPGRTLDDVFDLLDKADLKVTLPA